MKIVVDANIFISSFFWGGSPRRIVERIIAGKDVLFITKEILDEIGDVIRRPKFHASENEIHYFMNSIEELGNRITAKNKIENVSIDEDDNKYIECGIAASVDYIISGDKHLLEIEEYENIKIIDARKYLEIVE